MSKSGTTQSSILKRRRRLGQNARIKSFVRRHGWTMGGLCVILCGFAWAILGGLPERAVAHLRQSFYDTTANAGFTIQNIMVEGRINADPETLRRAIGFKRGDPMFQSDPAAIRARLEQIPWVRSARVERRLPDTLYIRLAERVPAALWQNKGQLRLIDTDGVALTAEQLERFRTLLLVVGEDAPAHMPDLSAMLATQRGIQDRVEAATLVGGRRWDLRLKTGVIIRLPETDPAVALGRLAKAEKDDRILEKDLTIIDLRDGDRIIVSAKPGEAQAYKGGGPGSNI